LGPDFIEGSERFEGWHSSYRRGICQQLDDLVVQGWDADQVMPGDLRFYGSRACHWQATSCVPGKNHIVLTRACWFSGVDWVNKFPTSDSLDDLAQPFQDNVRKFKAALEAVGAHVHIIATYRPAERAYLMHYAWHIAYGLDPRDVPVDEMPVRICWVHRDANGNFDIGASIKAAKEMVGGPGCPNFPGPLHGYCMKDDAVFDFDATMAQVISGRPQRHVTQHFSSLAIDMTISWTGDLTITNGDGKQVPPITTTPRDANNPDLGKVGETYHVFKVQQPSDPGHWSANGH
jgi:hypothetical protein